MATTLRNQSVPSRLNQPARLLIVDDEPLIRTSLAEFLEQDGFSVRMAADGQQALELAQSVPFDLVLTDIQMPGMDGFEAIRRIRMDSSMAATPVVALTALAMPGDRQRCLEAGANEYISKPISLRYLADIIETEIQKTAAAQ